MVHLIKYFEGTYQKVADVEKVTVAGVWCHARTFY